MRTMSRRTSILDALIETRAAITELDARLDRIESRITSGG